MVYFQKKDHSKSILIVACQNSTVIIFWKELEI